jgi:hypothetical protein
MVGDTVGVAVTFSVAVGEGVGVHVETFVPAASLNVKVTETSCGELAAEVEYMAMVPTYTPGVTPKGSADNVTGSTSPVDAPITGFMNSQLTVSVSDQSITPVPEFHIFSTWCGGLVPPSVAVKLILVGL